MAYLGISILTALVAAVSVYADTGSLVLAVLAYAGAGVAVMIAAIVASAVALQFQESDRQSVPF